MNPIGLFAVALLAALAAPAATAEQPADPVATVGDRPISRRGFDEAAEAAGRAKFFHDVGEKQKADLGKEVLRGLVRKELDLLGGLDRGLVLDLAEGKRQVAAQEKQLGKKTYEASLKGLGWTREKHARVLAEMALAQEAYRKFVSAPSKVSDETVKQEYEKNRAVYRLDESRHLLHLVLGVPAGSPEEKWKARGTEIEALAARIRGGEKFEDVASASSEDMYRIKGGDVGWVHPGRLLPEIEAVAWKAADGALAGPVRAEDGWHLVKVVGIRPARVLGFDEAAPSIRRRLEKERLAAAEKAWYAEGAAKHPIRVLDPALAGGPLP